MLDLSAFPVKESFKIDEKTFFQLYEFYWKKLYQIALKYVGDSYQAEEVVQELFASLWQRRDNLILDGTTVEHYLVRAVRFRIAKIYSNEVRKTEKIEQLKQQASPDYNSTEGHILYKFLKRDVDKLVNMLPERCRDVYELSRLKGLKNREIAINLTISEKTVENQLTKALSFLRKGLKKYPRN